MCRCYIMTQDQRNALIDRAIAIQEEYKTLQRPRVSYSNIEDVDDVYQEALEFDYYIADLKAEYDDINKQLGITDRKLTK